MRKIAAGIAAASAVALAAGALAPSAMAAEGNKSLAAVLTAETPKFDKNWNDYDIVTAAVLAVLEAKPASPVGVLAKGDVALTAFIPSDRAFQTLVKDLTGKKPSTEAKTFAAVAGLGGIDLVETVLLYHVVPGATIDAADRPEGRRRLPRDRRARHPVNVKKGPVIRLKDRGQQLRATRRSTWSTSTRATSRSPTASIASCARSTCDRGGVTPRTHCGPGPGPGHTHVRPMLSGGSGAVPACRAPTGLQSGAEGTGMGEELPDRVPAGALDLRAVGEGGGRVVQVGQRGGRLLVQGGAGAEGQDRPRAT